MNVQDVVVDDYDELLWRLRAVHGVQGIRRKRIVCIGSAEGWGAEGREAPPAPAIGGAWSSRRCPARRLGRTLTPHAAIGNWSIGACWRPGPIGRARRDLVALTGRADHGRTACRKGKTTLDEECAGSLNGPSS